VGFAVSFIAYFAMMSPALRASETAA